MDRVDAVEEVLAEAALGHHAVEVAVRGRDEADVYLDGRVAAHAHDPSALECRQEFRLQVRREVADLVEEERAAVGRLELACPVCAGVGEGPLDVAEEFALEERFGDGSHIHGDHQFAVARRAVVDLAGEHLLAGAVLARDEDVGIGGRHLLDDLADAHHGGTRSPEHGLFLRQLALDLLQTLHLALRAGQRTGVAQGGDQPFVVPGLDHEIDRPVAHGPHRQVDVGIGGEEHHLDVGPVALDLLQPVEPFVAGVDPGREVHVEQHDVHRLPAQGRYQLIGRRKRQHTFEMVAQQQLQRCEDAAVVVHDEQGSLFGHKSCVWPESGPAPGTGHSGSSGMFPGVKISALPSKKMLLVHIFYACVNIFYTWCCRYE